MTILSELTFAQVLDIHSPDFLYGCGCIRPTLQPFTSSKKRSKMSLDDNLPCARRTSILHPSFCSAHEASCFAHEASCFAHEALHKASCFAQKVSCFAASASNCFVILSIHPRTALLCACKSMDVMLRNPNPLGFGNLMHTHLHSLC